MRGFPICHLCSQKQYPLIRRINGKSYSLGSAELRIFGEDGTICACPVLLLHFIEVHRYQPSDDFISAVMTSPMPPEPFYMNSIKQLGLVCEKKWFVGHDYE